jgi:Trk K+ transport system NAD-binding subunit
MAAVAYSETDAQALEQHGIDLVIRPHHAAAQEAAQSLVEAG